MSSMEHDNAPSPYRVPTHPIEASLWLTDGRRETVTLFLPRLSEAHQGPESLDEFLNRPRQFLPVLEKTGRRSLLVNRDSVRLVQVGPEAPVLSRLNRDMIGFVDLVRLELADGSILEGTLSSILPPEHPRLSDFFNLDQIFVPLELDDGTVFVNKRFVKFVWL